MYLTLPPLRSWTTNIQIVHHLIFHFTTPHLVLGSFTHTWAKCKKVTSKWVSEFYLYYSIWFVLEDPRKCSFMVVVVTDKYNFSNTWQQLKVPVCQIRTFFYSRFACTNKTFTFQFHHPSLLVTVQHSLEKRGVCEQNFDIDNMSLTCI